MKKLIFALAVLVVSLGAFAQEGQQGQSQVRKEKFQKLAPEQKAEQLKLRILRITKTADEGTGKELYNASLTFFKAKSEILTSGAKDAPKKIAELTQARETSFQKILGADRYAELQAQRKFNKELKLKGDKNAMTDEAIDE